MDFFKSRTFFFLLTVILLAVLVFVLGRAFAWPLTWTLSGVLGLLVLSVLGLGVGLARANRGAAAIERTIKSQAAQQLKSTRPDRRQDVDALREQLERAIEMLKQSKLGRGRRGRAALYALPWYLFIGPPGAGKTTAIANSGLNFPLGTNRIRGVGGTRNCDWFFSDSAILLDTAGRYMTEHEDSDEWFAFLDILKKHRKDQPINGVLVGISLAEIAGASIDDVEWHADTIRRRVDELVKRLGVRFPVYLVLTKCDLLQGFVEFFGSLSRKDREQVWGCTLDVGQQDEARLQAVFEEEFDRLREVLIDRRGAGLSRPMKRADRQRVYAFPLQFASLRDNLSAFVGRLFQPNPYQETAHFRGFYFTSGTQEGVPIDRVIEAIAHQFDLQAGGRSEAQAATEAKSYFIKDLFTEVIIPDQHMARRTSHAVTRGRLLKTGLGMGAAIVLGAFLLWASLAFIDSRRSLRQTNELVYAAAFTPWEEPGRVADHLDGLDRLRTRVDGLDRWRFLRLGLNRDDALHDPARRVYVEQVRAFIETYPLARMRADLQAGRSGGLPDDAQDRLRESLKAYRLLTGDVPRLEEEDYAVFLTDYLTEQSVAVAGTPDVQADSSGALKAALGDFVDALRADARYAFAPDDALVDDVARQLSDASGVSALYDRLRREGARALDERTLADVDGLDPSVFSGSPSVPGLYTREGWSTFAEERIREESRNPSRDDWVTGGAARGTMPEAEVLEAELRERYFADYGRAWEEYLRALHVRPFGSLAAAGKSLAVLGDPYESPILYVLNEVTSETRLGSPGRLEALGEQAEGAADRAGLDADRPGAALERRFRWLHDLKVDQTERAPHLMDAVRTLSQVSLDVERMAEDEGRLQDNLRVLDEARSSVERSLVGTDPAVLRLFTEPLDAVGGLVEQGANAEVAGTWSASVLEPLRRDYLGRYPFSPEARDAVLLDDFVAFFEPGGTFSTFASDLLGDVRPGGDCREAAVRVGPRSCAAIQQLLEIQQVLFRGSELRLDFEMKPPGAGQVERQDLSEEAPVEGPILLRLHGASHEHVFGSSNDRIPFTWPGTSNGASIEARTRGDRPVGTPKRYEGPWALFRLIDAAQVSPAASGSGYTVRWAFGETGRYRYDVVYTLYPTSRRNPFRDVRAFFDVDLPDSLFE